MSKVYLRPVDQQERVDSRLLALRSLGFQFAAHRGSGRVVVGDEPDFLFPRTTIWRATGTANDVIDNLLSLADPEPAESKIPFLSSACGFSDR